MNYIAPRNMTVTSLSGRSVEFKKGEPTPAPPQMHQELIAKGIVPENEVEDEPVDEKTRGPEDVAAREAAFFAAFEAMVLKNDRKAFTAGGTPHAAALAKELGWTEVDAKERDAVWVKFQASKA